MAPHVTSFPYARDEALGDKALTVVMWLASVMVAPWIITFPPVSYEGLGFVASMGWGLLAGAGALLILIGALRQSYIVEFPGVFLMGSGIFIYALLSWGQVGEGVFGSGARALLMVTFFCWLVKRGRKLVRYHLTLKRVDRIGRRAARA